MLFHGGILLHKYQMSAWNNKKTIGRFVFGIYLNLLEVNLPDDHSS